MEVQVRFPSHEFDFNNGRASPGTISPSTPKGFGNSFLSAPTSPARAFDIYRQFEEFSLIDSFPRDKASTSASSSQFDWDEGGSIDDFTFATITTKEFKSAEKHQEPETINSPLLYPLQSPKPIKSQHKKSLWSAFSPKRTKKSKPVVETSTRKRETRMRQGGRGRDDRISSRSQSRRGATRSLSPPRVSKYPFELEEEQKPPPQNPKQSSTTAISLSSKGGSRRWRLKEYFLLFRSASEGRSSDKDPFRKYAEMYRKNVEVAKSSAESSSTVTPASRRGLVSAHELHYMINKEISQDMKKKSFLPYKQGIVGRLAFNPTIHALAHGSASPAHHSHR